MALERNIFVGLNSDDSPKDMPEGDYRDCRNLVPVKGGASVGVRRENMRGMVGYDLPNFTPSNQEVCIGIHEHKEDGKLYIFTTGAYDTIYEYDIAKNEWQTIIVTTFGWDTTINIHSIFVIEDLLYWADPINGPLKVNIPLAASAIFNNVTDIRLFSVIKPPPTETITLNRETSNTISNPSPKIREVPLQAVLRYVYLDDEISVFGPVSKVAPVVLPPQYINSDASEYNYIEALIKYNAGLKDILKRVELIVREGNDQPWYLYDKLSLDQFDASGNLTYQITLDKAGPTIPETEYGDLFYAVPRIANSIAYAEDRMFAPASLEDYDPAIDDWACGMNVFSYDASDTVVHPSLGGIDLLYPRFYKGNSKYAWGVVFLDEFGRQSSVQTNPFMKRQTPDVLATYSLSSSIDNLIAVNEEAIRATPFPSGTPPVWAVKYKIVRTNNLSYSSWYKCRALCKPLLSDNTYEADSEYATHEGYYYENGSIYVDVHKRLKDIQDGNSSELDFGSYFDLFLPSDIPIPVDEESIIRIAYFYPDNGGTIVKEYGVYRILEGVIRIKGLDWVDWKTMWYDEAIGHTGVLLNQNPPSSRPPELLYNDETYIFIEILNPKKETDDNIYYEDGKVYNIVNPGEANRRFQNVHDSVEGDCYHTQFSEPSTGRRDSEAGSYLHSNSSAYAQTLDQMQIYSAQSPVAQRLYSDKFNKSASNNQGKATTTVPDEDEREATSLIRYSRTYVENSYINGLSDFASENQYPISSDRGPIVKLVKVSEHQIVAVHTRAISSIWIKRKYIKDGENNDLQITSSDVIGDDEKLLLDLGTSFPESVVSNNNRVYGFDLRMAEPWRRSLDGITPLATTFKMKTYFDDKAKQIRNISRIDPNATIEILGGYDPWLEMYILTFSEIQYTDGQNQIVIPAETIGFSELVKRWVVFFDFYPEYYITADNNLASVKDGKLWIHREGAARNTFYDVAYDSKIILVANDINDVEKRYESIALSSNDKWSVEIETPEGQLSSLEVTDFYEKDNMLYASFLRDSTTPQDTLSGKQTPLLHGRYIIGQTLQVTLINSNNQPVNIDAAYIGYNPAVGHLLQAR